MKYPGTTELIEASHLVEIEDIDLATMGADAQQKAKQLYYTLALHIQGKARQLAKNKTMIPEGNGFLLWRHMLNEYEPEIAGRHQTMLIENRSIK